MKTNDSTYFTQVLSQYWGYGAFRPLQEEVVRSVVEGNDTLVLFPTGGGKSICYQVPALVMEGLTLVISPLIALMKDQVTALKEKGIKAACIYSGMHPEEVHMVYSNVRYGGTKLLYVSPERLQSESFRNNLPHMKVNLLAVDEAHCISQWGHDFRPDYRRIAEIKTYFPNVPILALTATATPKVVEDIKSQLEMKSEKVFKKSFVRKNLIYVALKESDKIGRMKRVIENIGGTGIIYVRNRKKTVEYAQFLSRYTTTDFYHAGLTMQSRNRKQQKWMEGKTKLMVCTNAFGMGIDKSDVRYVIHVDIPQDIESYFQEAGRGGRDGNLSYAIILYDDKDVDEANTQLKNRYPDISFIRSVYEALGNYFQIATGVQIEKPLPFDINHFVKQYNYNIIWVYNALRFLEKEGYIHLNQAIKQPSSVHIKVDKETLYQYQLNHPKDDELIKLLLRSYSGLFTHFTIINERVLAKRMQYTEKEIVEQLRWFEKQGLISYQYSHDKPEIIYLTPRLSQSQIKISPENYHHRKEQAKSRLLAMLQYLKDKEECRSQVLVKYFGETSTYECEKCDNCIDLKAEAYSDVDFQKMLETIQLKLQKQPADFETLSYQKTAKEQRLILNVIQYLLDHHMIVKKTNQYYWNTEG